MFLPDPQFARSDVLRVFNHAQVYLFLGAAITTVGIVAAFFTLLRRRLDPLLLWFALFALLYGIRLEMNYQLLWGLGLRPLIFQRFVIAIGFLIPVPAFFFFQALNILGRSGRIASTIVWPIVSSLAVATLLVGPRDLFRVANNAVVIAALIVIVVALVRAGAGTGDINLIRGALFSIYRLCPLRQRHHVCGPL
jgi:sigma-B regulation protein RsbU (phosphoserine phosphatase)